MKPTPHAQAQVPLTLLGIFFGNNKEALALKQRQMETIAFTIQKRAWRKAQLCPFGKFPVERIKICEHYASLCFDFQHQIKII